jgi:hypothetical protein
VRCCSIFQLRVDSRIQRYISVHKVFEEMDEKQAERKQSGRVNVCMYFESKRLLLFRIPLRDSTILRLRGPPCLVLADAITQHSKTIAW